MIEINDFVQITFIICASIIICKIIDCKYGKKTAYEEEIYDVKEEEWQKYYY